MTRRSGTERDFFLDLSTRAKLRVTGADRFRFINGQITNDLRKANETAAVEACVLNAKGKMNAEIFIAALGETFLIDAEPELREMLRARLERYVIADDVQIEDVTDEFSLFHIFTERWPAVRSGRMAPALRFPPAWWVGAGAGRSVSGLRFAPPGWDVWSDSARHDAVRNELSSAYVFTDSAA